MLLTDFFNQDACVVAKALLGKLLRRKYQGVWLCARIIETEAYYIHDKASHASLGLTHSRRALFMPAGTIYMYYSRGGPSLNISCEGEGNAVLIKSAYPYGDESMIQLMQSAFPMPRPVEKLCSGQTLLCKSLRLSVEEWNTKQFSPTEFYMEDVGLKPKQIIQTTRLGIPLGRDEHLLYRFVDQEFTKFCTKNPLSSKRV